MMIPLCNIRRVLFYPALLIVICGMVSAAAVTPGITYQGKLTNAAGSPLTGTYTVTFRLYDASTGGTTLSTDTHGVTATNGLFTTPIAITNSTLVDGRALWLGIKVGADAEMTPRQEIRPVPYALSLRPGAVVQDGSFTSSTAGTSWSTIHPGINVSTQYNYNPAIRFNTSGSLSYGIFGNTRGPNSYGAALSTEGLNSYGIVTNTKGSGSPGVYAYTTGSSSPAIWGESAQDVGVKGIGKTGGYFSTNTGGGSWLAQQPGVNISTTFDYNPGIIINTEGADSQGVDVTTKGLSTDAIVARTKGDSSAGVKSTSIGTGSAAVSGETYGPFSGAFLAHTYEDNSYGYKLEMDGDRSIGIYSDISGDNSDAIIIRMAGTNSPGVSVVTGGSTSNAIDVTTFGSSSIGVDANTGGQNSPGMRSITAGESSPGITVNTMGLNSIAVDASTNSKDSPGILSNTRGPNSRGLYVLTEGETSPGMVAHTFRNYSEGVYSVTDGAYSHGVYVKALGSSSQGVNASSAQATAVWADTGRADHMYGVQTPDYMRAARYDTGSSDVAEYMPVAEEVSPGTVLVIGDYGRLEPASTPYDTRVAGIVSTAPGVTLGTRDTGNPGEQIIAIAGRVPCNVDASNGPIHHGDLLTTSGNFGYAMKATNPRIGTVLGKAMGTLESGTGTIEVLVTLQ